MNGFDFEIKMNERQDRKKTQEMNLKDVEEWKNNDHFVDLNSVMLTCASNLKLNGPHSGVYTSDLQYHKSVALVPCNTTQRLVYGLVNYNLQSMIFCLVWFVLSPYLSSYSRLSHTAIAQFDRSIDRFVIVRCDCHCDHRRFVATVICVLCVDWSRNIS